MPRELVSIQRPLLCKEIFGLNPWVDEYPRTDHFGARAGPLARPGCARLGPRPRRGPRRRPGTNRHRLIPSPTARNCTTLLGGVHRRIPRQSWVRCLQRKRGMHGAIYRQPPGGRLVPSPALKDGRAFPDGIRGGIPQQPRRRCIRDGKRRLRMIIYWQPPSGQRAHFLVTRLCMSFPVAVQVLRDPSTS